MKNDILNILANSSKDIDNQQLMDYLSGKLNDEQAHAIEQVLADNDFGNDALEGLMQMKDKTHLEQLVAQLNKDLHKKLDARKSKKEKRRIKEQPYVYIALIIILTLVILAYFVIHQLQKH